MPKKEKKKSEPAVIYYRDELNDEFSVAEITPRPIDGSYRYDRNKGLSRIACFFWYRVVAMPIAFCYLKLKFRHKIKGRKALKTAKKQGFFIYGNHTQIIGDALIPTFVRFPHDACVIVHPNNVSMPYLGRVTPYMGALPLPDDKEAARNFTSTVEKRLQQKKAVFIYPEAHIWPYYTGVRPFTDASFFYPVKYKTPVFCFTNTYQKRRFSKNPRIVTYVDGPFYPDESLSPRARRIALRNAVYDCMTERSRLSDCVVVEYRKAQEETL
jgi:1-acyl-sn-glycerol-3-phosphate acyltransferase